MSRSLRGASLLLARGESSELAGGGPAGLFCGGRRRKGPSQLFDGPWLSVECLSLWTSPLGSSLVLRVGW